jgi:acyl transferase domain-containing protein/phosphopantetheinyl transferase (holo-ACP synthase)
MSTPAPGTAIVGMGALFPGAPDLDAYLHNLTAGVDAIGDVPPSRWDPIHYDPSSTAPDRFYCRRGGFVDGVASFDPLRFGIMPVAARGAEPDQLLALEVAARALDDAGYGPGRSVPGATTGVLLGRGGYLSQGMARLDQRVRTAQQLVDALAAAAPGLDAATLDAARAAFLAELGPFGPDTAIGLVPNLAASRIANRLDLQGPAYTIDAACASALVAVDQACQLLETGRADLMLAGGVHLCHDPTFWSVFSQLGALSRAQRIRPFDRRADGLLIGEGVGVVVLKRAADAERDGDRIYAVVRGTGLASDGREASLMTPRVEGQLLALERAWRAAGLEPSTVGLVEAHGTATPAGDAAELTTLARFFGPADARAPRAGLGSVKSMIGHAMPAAGAAGLIKAALAVHHGLLLPTLHCEEPSELVAATRFRPIQGVEPWEAGPNPRRAAVNAFGFGGIDAHVVLEEHGRGSRAGGARLGAAPGAGRAAPAAPTMLRAAASTPAELLAALASGAPSAEGGPCRLAMVSPSPERLTRARAIVERGQPWRGRDGIWFSPRGLEDDGGRVALLFPGVDASFQPRVDDVIERFRWPLPIETEGRDLERVGLGIVAVNRLMHHVLGRLGVVPEAMAGHSIGEWSAMIASEMIPADAIDPLLATLVPGTLEVPGVVFAAAGTSAERVAAAIDGLPEIAVSHDNCPHQVLLCGREESVDAALARVVAGGALGQKLPFRSGFHSPLFEGFVAPHRERLGRIPLAPPKVPLWSATTAAPYPAGLDDVRRLAVEHLVRPVRFRELVLALYAEGFRVFVQAGTGSLVGFVDDTLRGLPHLAIAANAPQRTGLEQLAHVACALFVEGHPIAFERLEGERAPAAHASRGAGRPGTAAPLALGAPPARLPAAFVHALAHLEHDARPPPRAPMPPPIVGGEHPLIAEHAALLSAIGAAGDDVLAAWSRGPAERAPAAAQAGGLGPRRATFVRELSVEAFPALLDHTFYRQPEGWPKVVDRYPVVPMTMLLEMMLAAAGGLVPERVPVALEDVRALKWLVVEPPVTALVSADYDGGDVVAVSIEGHASANVRLAPAYAPPPPVDARPLGNERPAPITAAALYAERYMFHGPRYQGVVELSAIADDGVRGVLESLEAEGGLLDNAGQLLGYWVMNEVEADHLAMPVALDRVELFGPHPAPGERLDCVVRIRSLGDADVRADVELSRGGRVWARIAGWQDRRFDSDARVWAALRFQELHGIASLREGGLAVLPQPWTSAASRDLLARRYLDERERAEYDAAPPRRKSPWLLGRMALKDAARAWLWERGHGPIFPIEIEVESDAEGRPRVRVPGDADLRASIAHKEGLAVARVAEGHDVGVDVERIEARGADFEETALADAERALLPSADRDAWVTRFWAAKEAVAKARGTGLGGSPASLPIERVDGERLVVDGEVVETRREGDLVLAFTVRGGDAAT